MSSGWLRYCSSEACSIAISSGAPVERLRSSNIVRHSYIGKRKACLRPVSLAIAALPQPLYETADAVSAVKSTVSVVASTGILLTLATSALPLQQSQKRTEARQTSNEEEAEGVKWGLMSVVSCLPLFNWLVCLLPSRKKLPQKRVLPELKARQESSDVACRRGSLQLLRTSRERVSTMSLQLCMLLHNSAQDFSRTGFPWGRLFLALRTSR